MFRENTKEIRIGDRVIGGNNPILIQSMTNTKTEDVEATVAQIKALTEAGCDIIRCAVPNMEAAKALAEDGDNGQASGVDAELEAYILAMIEERKAAKKEKNFARADEIRNELLEKGIALEDTREGVKWKMV